MKHVPMLKQLLKSKPSTLAVSDSRDISKDKSGGQKVFLVFIIFMFFFLVPELKCCRNFTTVCAISLCLLICTSMCICFGFMCATLDDNHLQVIYLLWFNMCNS